MDTLTPEHKVMVALERHHALTGGRPATVREIASACGWTSPATAHHYLVKLATLGQVEALGRQGYRIVVGTLA